MHQTKKGEQWYFGMKAHIGVDADSGLVHTVTTTAANESDVEQLADLLHGKEQQVWADSGYRGAPARVDRDLQWHIAARPTDMARLPKGRKKTAVRKAEYRKASVRAKVEHPFRVIKRQFGLAKVRFRGLPKNTSHVITLFALSNLWMARKQLIAMMEQSVRKRLDWRQRGRAKLRDALNRLNWMPFLQIDASGGEVIDLFRPSLVRSSHEPTAA